VREVIIYQSPQLTAKIKRLFARRWLSRIGNCLLILALIGFVFTYGPLLKAELGYRLRKNIGQRGYFGDLLKINPPTPVIVAPDPNFSLVIPKINARAKILANVDASKPAEYLLALKKGVAHARGTVFPGMKGTIYLFAHSAAAPWQVVRYNAVFYLLRELEVGDQIIVFFAGKRFNYQVTEKKIVEATETNFFSQKKEEILVLQTCHPPGTTQKALLIFAERNLISL